MGMAAGKVTKTNKLGYVVALPISFFLANINAFELGARSVNPQAETRGLHQDLPRSRQGSHGGQRVARPGRGRAGRDRGLADHGRAPPRSAAPIRSGTTTWAPRSSRPAAGSAASLSPGAISTRSSPARCWTARGRARTSSATWAMTSSPSRPSAWPPADAARLVNAKKQELTAGTAHPFTGPLKDNRGVERVKAGETFRSRSWARWTGSWRA